MLHWPPAMGTFHTKCVVQNHTNRNRRAPIRKVLVDTGSEHTWISEATLEKIGVRKEKKDLPFVMANGKQITRSVGFAIIRIDDHFTIDEVVFAEEGDLQLLGARTLEGLNLIVDSRRKKLVAAGPIPAACAPERIPGSAAQFPEGGVGARGHDGEPGKHGNDPPRASRCSRS